MKFVLFFALSAFFMSSSAQATSLSYRFEAEVDPSSFSSNVGITPRLNDNFDTFVDMAVTMANLTGTITFSNQLSTFQTPTATRASFLRPTIVLAGFDMALFEDLPFITRVQNNIGNPPFDTISGLLFGTNGDGVFDTVRFTLTDDTASLVKDTQNFPTGFSFQEFTSGILAFESYERSGQSRIARESAHFSITSFERIAPVPLPASILFLLGGMAGLMGLRKRTP